MVAQITQIQFTTAVNVDASTETREKLHAENVIFGILLNVLEKIVFS